MIDKRAYPPIGEQLWEHVFFMHWQVDEASLQAYIPSPFQLDTFQGSAWVTVVCFVAKKSRIPLLPIDLIDQAIQINVRTYVTCPSQKERGVYFLDVNINNRLAAIGAQRAYNLPFQYVEAELVSEGECKTYKSGFKSESTLKVTLRPTSKTDQSELAQFLTERYTIWNHKGKRLIKIPINHSHWKLTKAEAIFYQQDLHPLIVDKKPDFIHFAGEKLAYLYPYEAVGFYLSE